MEEQRQAILDHMVEVSRRFFHRNLQLQRDRQLTDIDLTMPQLKVLFVLVSLGGATMSQVARSVGMTLPTATGVADRLVSQGMARRVNDSVDRRVVRLYPSDQATALVDRLNQFSEAQLRLIAGHMTTEELALVARAQDILYEAMGKVTSEELAATATAEPSVQRAG
jgi:MarR family transcriptional regulator, organic hydroperoxide resistance regulator